MSGLISYSPDTGFDTRPVTGFDIWPVTWFDIRPDAGYMKNAEILCFICYSRKEFGEVDMLRCVEDQKQEQGEHVYNRDISRISGNWIPCPYYALILKQRSSSMNFFVLYSIRTLYNIRVAPDADVAGCLAHIFAGYPTK